MACGNTIKQEYNRHDILNCEDIAFDSTSQFNYLDNFVIDVGKRYFGEVKKETRTGSFYQTL